MREPVFPLGRGQQLGHEALYGQRSVLRSYDFFVIKIIFHGYIALNAAIITSKAIIKANVYFWQFCPFLGQYNHMNNEE